MRLLLAVAMIVKGAGARAKEDPLAQLPDAPPPVVRQVAQPVAAASSNTTQMGFAGYKLRLAGLARSAGVREATIQGTVPYLSLNSRVIQLDRGQPGGT